MHFQRPNIIPDDIRGILLSKVECMDPNYAKPKATSCD